MVTFGQQVEQARGILGQYVTNRPILATFGGWVGDPPYEGINLSGLPNTAKLYNAIVELGHELVYVSQHDPETLTTQCPPWFRQQQGSPANDDYPENSVAVINPQFPYWHVAQAVAEGVRNLYPDLFQVKTAELSTVLIEERYLLPADVEEIISIKYEDLPPIRRQRQVSRYSVDHSQDGNHYLFIEQVPLAGRTIYITYRAKPVIPDPTLNSDWSLTGLPATASDLPVYWAVASLLPAAEAAKTQTMSVEQSERNRFVQPGSATAASRRIEELYQRRLEQERRKLLDTYPGRIRWKLND